MDVVIVYRLVFLGQYFLFLILGKRKGCFGVYGVLYLTSITLLYCCNPAHATPSVTITVAMTLAGSSLPRHAKARRNLVDLVIVILGLLNQNSKHPVRTTIP